MHDSRGSVFRWCSSGCKGERRSSVTEFSRSTFIQVMSKNTFFWFTNKEVLSVSRLLREVSSIDGILYRSIDSKDVLTVKRYLIIRDVNENETK